METEYVWMGRYISVILVGYRHSDTVFSARITGKAESLLQDLVTLCK